MLFLQGNGQLFSSQGGPAVSFMAVQVFVCGIGPVERLFTVSVSHKLSRKVGNVLL